MAGAPSPLLHGVGGRTVRDNLNVRTIVAIVVGITIGALVGLSARSGPATVVTARLQADVAPTVKDYVVLVSGLYAVDHDVERARARLAQLGLPDPAAEVETLAQQFRTDPSLTKDNQKLLVDLATLGQALGVKQPELLAYVATPTPKARPVAAPKTAPTATAAPTTPAPTPLPTVDWDIRLSAKLEPPIKVVPATVKSGETYWRLIRAYWQNPDEGHQAHHIFANVLNKEGIAMGQPIIVENGGKTTVPAQPKPDSDYLINFPMAGTLGSYSVYVAGDTPSDRINGLGLGFAKGGKDHTCFLLTFQETIAP
jgi:hypothetical protein